MSNKKFWLLFLLIVLEITLRDVAPRVVNAQGGHPIYGSVVSIAPPDLTFTQRFDYDSNGNAIYVGIADSTNAGGPATSAAVWFIQKNTYDGNGRCILIQNANGSPKPNQIWDNRASLSYQ